MNHKLVGLKREKGGQFHWCQLRLLLPDLMEVCLGTAALAAGHRWLKSGQRFSVNKAKDQQARIFLSKECSLKYHQSSLANCNSMLNFLLFWQEIFKKLQFQKWN